MIYEAKLLGAQAVLLIARLLSTAQIARGVELCDELGMSALVEAHDEAEVRKALAAGARVVGVNNRNLADFTVDVSTAESLRPLVPADVLFVAESGIRTPADVARLRAAGVDAVLVGETLMRAADKRAALNELRGESA
jgi:indole-3-glycerol phosphate synthase